MYDQISSKITGTPHVVCSGVVSQYKFRNISLDIDKKTDSQGSSGMTRLRLGPKYWHAAREYQLSSAA